ncbi:MAG: hypothetical protein Ta2F_06720 [Termitinemataceae bacterium]|nr:MAG: hypothetical protein Ta2F_06720 [Termitinemataceae bacterium]
MCKIFNISIFSLLVFTACALTSCTLISVETVVQDPIPVEMSGRVIIAVAEYADYTVQKVHVYTREGILLGSADTEIVTLESGREEIHWKKNIPVPDGTKCTFWVQIYTPVNKRLYYNEGHEDIIISGSQYDLLVSNAQLPIFTPSDLKRIGSDPDLYPMDEKYVLIRDIKLSGLWEPFGKDSVNAFRGEFNGNFRTISNLSLDGGSREFVGLFGYIQKATLKNLFLYISDDPLYLTTITGQNVGVLAACAEDSDIENIAVRGGLNGLTINKEGGASLAVGGIVGSFLTRSDRVANPYRIYGCASEILIAVNSNVHSNSVNDRNSVGGIAGYLYRDTPRAKIMVERCFSSETISFATNSNAYVGGLLGYYVDNANTASVPVTPGDDPKEGMTIKHCYNSGDVSGEGENIYAGGILGSAKSMLTPAPSNAIVLDKIVAMNGAINISAANDYGINRISGGAKNLIKPLPLPPPLPDQVAYSLEKMMLSPAGTAGGEEGGDVFAPNITRLWFVTTMGWDFSSIWEWNTRLKRPVFQW